MMITTNAIIEDAVLAAFDAHSEAVTDAVVRQLATKGVQGVAERRDAVTFAVNRALRAWVRERPSSLVDVVTQVVQERLAAPADSVGD